MRFEQAEPERSLKPTIAAPALSSRIERRWDAVIIGAGPAGCVAARELARAGRRVLLLDRTPPPREKVCGCCLAPDGVHRLSRLGLETALEGAAPMRTIQFRAGSRSVRVRREGYLVLSRSRLDARLAEAAMETGAESLWPASARVDADGVVHLRTSGGEHTLRPAAVVAADGINGTSLRNVPAMGWRLSRRSLQGAGAQLDARAIDLNSRELLMTSAREGYVGLVRLEDGRIDIAGAVRPRVMREIGGPAEAAARVLESCGVDGASLRTVRWRGTGLLTRRRLAASGPIFAIGDAAGYAEPITGEGMSWAIESGAALADLLASRPAGADGLDHRWRARQARIRHRQMLCRGTALALRCPPLVRAACAVAGSWPAAGRWTASRIGRPAGEGGA